MNKSRRHWINKAFLPLFSIIFLVNLQINAQITVSLKDTIPTCLGANFKIITTTNAGSSATFSWTGPNGFTSIEKDASIVNLIEKGMGVYSLTVTEGNQNATATDRKSVV